MALGEHIHRHFPPPLSTVLATIGSRAVTYHLGNSTELTSTMLGDGRKCWQMLCGVGKDVVTLMHSQGRAWGVTAPLLPMGTPILLNTPGYNR